ncbi:MAG: hypothetical protein LC655_09490 [Bacteroidales bacterium]|nr:hypothetical protein [Bacteroidales bacterium]
MRALEFKTKIKDNQISIPTKLQAELKTKQNKNVRVILLVEDAEMSDEVLFQQTAQEQFLKGYSDEDSIYDNQS